jgi:hypothetical protein
VAHVYHLYGRVLFGERKLPLIRINAHLTEREVEEVRLLAQKVGISFAEMLRRLLDEALAQHGEAVTAPRGSNPR